MPEPHTTTSRRSLHRSRITKGLASVAAASSVLALTGCTGGTADENTITIYDWSATTGTGYTPTNNTYLYEPCAEELGVTVEVDNPIDYSKIRTAIESGNVPWDLMNVQNDFGSSPDELEAIDYSIVDRDRFSGDYAQDYRVGSDVQATAVAYNSDLFPSGFDSFADFFDTETYPGKRAVPKSLFAGLIEAALIADGVPKDEIYSMPLDETLDRAFAKLDTIKDDLVFWETGADSQSKLSSGEAVAGLVWVNRADDAVKNDGAPLEVVKSEWIQTDDYWVIPKGAPNAELAQKFINCITDPEKQVQWANHIVFGPTTTEALESPELEANPNRPTSYMEGQVKVDDDWWTENYKAIAERYNSWMLS